MARLNWTEQAREDLRLIVAYLNEFSPQAARTVSALIRKRVASLRQFPLLGSDFEDESGVREFVEGKYRIFYRFDQPEVLILRIIHSARDQVPL